MAKGNEIEGKWLNPEHWLERVVESNRIRQGYVAQDPNGNVVRLRQMGDFFFQTVKGSPTGPGEKPEEEKRIDEDFFDAFWQFTRGRRLEKVRHIVPMVGYVLLGEAIDLVAEVDVFEGELAGLVMVEVEVPTSEHLADLRANKPVWFGQDVTDDTRYGNSWLASNGIPLEG